MPQCLSIPRIIRQHPREPLFVQPLEWTVRHLELLGCSFEEEDSNSECEMDGNSREQSSPDWRPFDYYTQAAEDLATSETKNTAMIQLLADSEGPLKLFRSYGFFHYRAKYQFRLHGANFTFRSKGASFSSSKTPILVFMQHRMIKIQRQNLYPLGRGRQPNEPVNSLLQRRLDSIEPANHYEDPYILAVLIGLAQSQAKFEFPDKNPNHHCMDRIYQTGALFVDEDPEYMRFYTCPISVAFLKTFEYPEDHWSRVQRHSTANHKHLTTTIRYRKIPFQPYSNLRQRILECISPLITPVEGDIEKEETVASEKMKLSSTIFNL